MEEIKRKRGRPRKNSSPKIPQEIKTLIEDVLEKAKLVELPKKESDNTIIISDSTFQWDIKKDDPIEYFDANLSYELTGYRPITATLSLDFDPDWFTETRETFNRTGHYCEFPYGSQAFREFWRTELMRCKYGMTSHGYTITGDHYFFLNFYRLKDLVNVKEAGGGRNDIFPNFLEGQYEWFHYLKMAKMLKLNACMMKARAAGYSEIEAAILANSYNCIRGSVNVACAFASTLLDKLLTKVYDCLTFLNEKTDRGMFKSRTIDKQYLKRSGQFKVINGLKVEVGWKSSLQGIVVDLPGKLRGDRTDLLMFEECFGKGTKVIMSNYTVKNIEDIAVGDFVLGLDGTPLEVMNICNGIDLLYQIKLKRGVNYIVNSKHKLYLERRPRVGGVEDFIDLFTVEDYRNLSKYNQRTTYGKFNSEINNISDKCIINPYYLGCWLGDGWSENPSRIIVNKEKDIEIYNFIIEYFNSFPELHLSETNCENCKQCVRLLGGRNLGYNNPILKQFKLYNLINNKHIPSEVFESTLEYKLQVLAGLIDTDGNLNKVRYEISMSRKSLIYEISMLARSCGFEVYYSEKILKKGYGAGSIQHRIQIKGNINKIPVKVARKISFSERYNTTNSTPIEIEDYGKGEYFGITLKSYNKPTDNLFLLEDFTIVHNCGLWPSFTKAYTQSDALVGQIGYLWGLRLMGGTGGETGEQVKGLKKMFYEPKMFGVLPFKHNYTLSGEYIITSFFLPAFRTIKENYLLDHRGWISDEAGKEYFEKARRLKEKDPEEYYTFCAEFCNNDTEAFLNVGVNKFNKLKLAELLVTIRIKKLTPTIQRGYMEFIYSGPDRKRENIIGVRFRPNSQGPIHLLEEPIWENKKDVEKIRNLYVAGIDGIDIGALETSDLTKDPSKFCTVIKKRIYGMNEPMYVAYYLDRPNDIRDAYKQTIGLLMWYSCLANIEATRLSLLTYARDNKFMLYFMKRPRVCYGDNLSRRSNNQYGTTATKAMIDHQTDLIATYVEDYCHNIWFLEFLEQLSLYTDEGKGAYDIVAALGMCEVADEELAGITPCTTKPISQDFLDIGYYKDEKGYTRFGVIPKNNIPLARFSWDLYDGGNVTSNPNYR